MYARHKEIDAMAIRDQLKTAGYDVNCMGRSSQIKQSRIIGYNTSVSDSLILEMQQRIPEISEFVFEHNPVRTYCDSSDIVIAVKDDD